MILLLLALGCATDSDLATDSGYPCADQPGVTWNNFGDGFFAGYCRACHSAESADRYDAPEGVDFDTLDDVRSYENRIRVRVLDEQTMPVGGGLYEDDVVLLEIFLDCGL